MFELEEILARAKELGMTPDQMDTIRRRYFVKYQNTKDHPIIPSIEQEVNEDAQPPQKTENTTSDAFSDDDIIQRMNERGMKMPEINRVLYQNDLNKDLKKDNFIERWEKFRALPYKDSGGVWTIGYGTTEIDGKPVTKNTPEVTKEEARVLKEKYEAVVRNALIKNARFPIDKNLRTSLMSFGFNNGDSALAKLLKRFDNPWDLIKKSLEYVNVKSKAHNNKYFYVPGIHNRRIDEYKKFIKWIDEKKYPKPKDFDKQVAKWLVSGKHPTNKYPNLPQKNKKEPRSTK